MFKAIYNIIFPRFRLITNTFTINSAGISPATRQQEQQERGAIRRQNMAPQHMNFDLKCDSPGKEPMESEDISFYSGHSPQASPTRPCPISPGLSSLASESPIQCSISRVNLVRQLSHQDTESADSGYTTSEGIRSAPITVGSNLFQFAEPRQPLVDPSPRKTPSKYIMASGGSAYNNICSLISPSSNFQKFGSFSSGSMDSMDDEYRDLIEMEAFEEDTQVPSNLSSLISHEIKSTRTTPEAKRNLVRSLFEKSPASTTPKSSINVLITTPERQCLQSISENLTPRGGFKRPEPPTISPNRSKRHKNENDAPFPSFTVISATEAPKRPLFRKSMSMNDANVANALDDPSLIGDYSKKLCLPLINDRQADLKAISVDTMMALLNGHYTNSVASFKVIDCRYPYEFVGGHIKGARNLYLQEQILAELVNCKTEAPQVTEDGPKRNILVFHCEFSSERGPKL